MPDQIIVLSGSDGERWFNLSKAEEIQPIGKLSGSSDKLYFTRVGGYVLAKAVKGNYKYIKPTPSQIVEWYFANGHSDSNNMFELIAGHEV